MEYSLRAATDADYDFLYALHVATLRDAVEATWGWDDAAQQAMFRDRWGSGQREIVVLDGEDAGVVAVDRGDSGVFLNLTRSEEHTSELQSQFHLVCRLLLEKKKKIPNSPLGC